MERGFCECGHLNQRHNEIGCEAFQCGCLKVGRILYQWQYSSEEVTCG
jgi:hypothetical protein